MTSESKKMLEMVEAEKARSDAEAEARVAASRQMISARIQAMLAAARKEIEELRRMLAEFGEKNDTAGVAICLRTLAEINMSATDHAMTFARERIVDELLVTKEKAGV
jgi:regulator of protease activity HflC (stomatin/prohibitin superfamily)